MNSKKKLGISELRVGILVVISIAILILMILTASGDISLFGHTITLNTRLSEVEGLKKGDEVRLAGVHVGQVESVRFSDKIPENPNVKEGTIIISMKVDANTAKDRIRTDSTVILGSIGLLGDKVLEITPGTQQGVPVKDGDFIKGSQETSVKELVTGANDILANFSTLSDILKDLGNQVREGKGTIGKFLYDESIYVNANRTVVQAEELMRRIEEGDGTAGKLINDPTLYNDLHNAVTQLSTLVADIQKGRGTLGKLATDDELYQRINKASDKLDSVTNKLDEITAQIRSGQGTAGRIIYDDKIAKDAETAIANLNRITDRLDKGEGTAGMLLHDDKLYNNLNGASSEVVKLLYDFRQNPKKYLSIKVSIF
ncbi:MAG TPA: MlaD family protein [Blastocatellia bacterium]|nr:MlaD family protein [Blastocatellia bacterium]